MAEDFELFWNRLEVEIPRKRGKRLPLTGRTFGRLYVRAALEERTKSGSALWDCLCVCGTPKKVSTDALIRGRTVSCGCRLKECQGKK